MLCENILDEFQNKINSWKNNSNEFAAIGYFSYEAKQLFYPHIKFKPLKLNIPIAWFGKPKIIKTINRTELHNFYSKSYHIKKTVDLIDLKEYDQKISLIKSYLKAGDVYQVNFTQPLEYELNDSLPIELFSALSKFSTPDCGVYLNMDKYQILSISPEKFFTKINNRISSYPIKGTRTRSEDPDEDEKLKKELMNSEKDQAEHVMIVDLIRNDLGKICNFGTVETNDLFKVHSFKTIHHMITEVTGELKQKIEEKDIFKTLFPGGSITGAPKQR